MKNSPTNRVIEYLSLLILGALIFSCSEKAAQMELTFSPPEADVTIDGYRPSALKSPHTFDFYKPGSYTLEVSAPGYTTVSMMISVEAGEVLTQSVHLIKKNEHDETPNVIAVSSDTDTSDVDEPPPPSPPGETDETDNEFELTVTSDPPGATVSAETPDKKSVLVFQTPGLRSLPKGQPWYLTISLDGYEPVKRTVVAPAGDTGVHLGVTLQQKNGGSSIGKMPIARPLQQFDDPPSDPPPTIAQPVPQRQRTLLTVQTTPATVVSLDGKVIGTTPVTAYEVTPGFHKILMENRDRGKRKVMNKRFATGEHIRIIQYLDASDEL